MWSLKTIYKAKPGKPIAQPYLSTEEGTGGQFLEISEVQKLVLRNEHGRIMVWNWLGNEYWSYAMNR